MKIKTTSAAIKISASLLTLLLFLMIGGLMPSSVHSQQEGVRNVAFVFDASGSMHAALEGTSRLALPRMRSSI